MKIAKNVKILTMGIYLLWLIFYFLLVILVVEWLSSLAAYVRVPKGRDMVKNPIHDLQDKYEVKLGEKQVWLVINLSQESGLNYITGRNHLEFENDCLEVEVE